ncbi:MAG: hypothetical protein IAE97_07420 [Chthoniobacterales bacterium]|nr:hypothetical protein [Chthoniobacterales bacterium]
MTAPEEDAESSFPTPEANHEVRLGSHVLTPRQLVLLRLLEAHDERLPKIYLGALGALHDKSHDYIAIAAHCLREVMDLAFTWSKGPSKSNLKMHEQLERLVRKPWLNLQKEAQEGHTIGDAPSLEPFVANFGQFIEWFDTHRPLGIERAGTALDRLQRRRKPPNTFERDRQEWHEILSSLKPIAHHKASTEEELLRLLDQLELLLLRYLRPSEPEKLQQIERVVAETGRNPTPETLHIIRTMVDGHHDRSAFFAAIRNASWLPILVEAGWFDPESPNGPQVDHSNAGTPEVDLLLRLVADATDDVAEAALLLAKLDDDWVRHQLLHLALKLPDQSRETFVGLATTWIEARRGSFILSRALVEFVGPIVQGGITPEVERLIGAALKAHPDPRLEEKETQRETEQMALSLLSPEPEPTLDSDSTQDFVTQLLNFVQPQDRLSLLRLFVVALSENIRNRTWPDEMEERGSYDGSVFWRGSVEDSEQNHHEDQRGILISAIRDLAEATLSQQQVEFSTIEEVLTVSHWMIFKRIRIHLLRTNPEAAGREQIRSCLFDNEVRNGTEAWHEWSLLLREQFRHLSKGDQHAILDWIITEPDLSVAISYYKDVNHGRSPTSQELDQWKADRWRQKLAIIKDSIPVDWKAAHPDLCEGLNSVEPIEFHYQSSGGTWIVQQHSPKTAEEIVKMPAASLVGELAHWREKDPYDGPSEAGLLGALKAASKQHSAKILAQINEYDKLSPARYAALLEGLWEVANEDLSVDWMVLLEATEKAVQEKVIPHAEGDANDREKSLGITLIRAIEVALDNNRPPRDHRSLVFKCIEAFLKHPDPTPKAEEKEPLPEQLSSTSLNTPRPIALRCVFAYDRWLRRGEITDSSEVLQTLEKVLRKEPSLGGRSVFGERMNWFLRHHRMWLESRLASFFPRADSDKRDAIWNCFVTMCRPSKAALEVLRSEYGRAIEACRSELVDKPSSDWCPQKGLIHHLCAYYWWGYEPIDSPSLLTTFFETATTSLREYVFRYIARVLHKTEGPLPAPVAKRFMDLADWRIAALKDEQPHSPETRELRGIVRWADSEKLPPEWTLRRLLQVLTLLSGSDFEHQLLPFDFLAKQVSTHPVQALACLHMLTFGPKKTPPWWGQEDKAKTILRIALNSGLPDVVHKAREVQDHLIRLGRLEYRLLEDGQNPTATD